MSKKNNVFADLNIRDTKGIYRIEPNIDIRDAGLRKLFQDSIKGRMDDGKLEETIERLLKNSGYDVDVEKKPEIGVEDMYAPHQGTFSAITRFWNKDTITLWSKDRSHIGILAAVLNANASYCYLPTRQPLALSV